MFVKTQRQEPCLLETYFLCKYTYKTLYLAALASHLPSVTATLPFRVPKPGMETPKPIQTAVMRLSADVLRVLGARRAPDCT